MAEVKALVIHAQPHLDEVCAIWLLRRFGQDEYPGCDTAKIVCWTTGGETPDGRSADEWEAEGYLALGLARGRFDEHPEMNGGRGHNPEDCTSMLVAKDLGVSGDPALTDILSFVNENDLKGKSLPFDLASLIRDLNKEFPDAPERVIEWGSEALEVKYRAAEQVLAGNDQDSELGVDEVCAVWLLRKFGVRHDPDIAKYPIKLMGPGEDSGEWTSQGYMVVHVGGDERSCDIAAEAMKVKDDPSLSQILHYSRTHLKGRIGPLELPSIIASFCAVHPDEYERAFKWSSTAFDTKHVVQQMFHSAKEDYEKAIKEENYIGSRKVMIVTFESDNPAVSRYARSKKFGCNAAVVIQKNSKGQVQVYASKRHGVNLDDVAKMLRLHEQRVKKNICTTDWRELGAHGRVTGAEEWWFHKEAGMLLNGSLSAPDVPPTNLDLETIRDIVAVGINPQAMPDDCRKRGRCVHGRDCEFYSYGLYRCYKLRKEEHERSRR